MTDMQEIIKIYKESFSENIPFEERLFGKGLEFVRFLEERGEIKSVLFLLPCTFVTPKEEIPAKYIFAAATKASCRKQGYMEKLLEKVKSECNSVLFLRPANSKLQRYYEKSGFKPVTGIASVCAEICTKPSPILEYLAEGYTEENGEKFTLMYFSKTQIHIDNIGFIYSME